MTDIKSFRRDAAAMRDGEWIEAGPEYGDLKIKCRDLGYVYLDTQARLEKIAARKFGGVERIPASERANINIQAMIQTALLDVSGLTRGGEPVSFAEFCELLLDPSMGELTSLAFICCGRVGRVKADDLEEAAKN